MRAQFRIWVFGLALAWSAGVVAAAEAADAPKESGLVPEGATAPHPSTVITGSSASVINPAAQPGAALPASISPAPGVEKPVQTFQSAWFGEMAKLAQAGMDERVMLAFAANAPGTFNLGTEQIIFLRDQGVSSRVINAMIMHDQEVNLGLIPLAASTVPLPFSASSQLFAADTLKPGDPEIRPPTPPASSTTPVKPINANQSSADSSPAGTGAPWFTREPINLFADYAPGQLEAALQPSWMKQFENGDEAPEQPDAPYPVRLPYPVKLTDRIFILWGR